MERKAIKALRRLVNCPDLNVFDLEEESILAIAQAQLVLDAYLEEKVIIEKFIKHIHTAYKYGLDQHGNRIEPSDTIISWCGYYKLPGPYEKAIYAAYKAGRFERLRQQKIQSKRRTG